MSVLQVQPHPSSDGWHPVRASGDDEVARRMLDGLLGGRPESIVRHQDAVCLATPRGLEVIDLPSFQRRPRIELGCRLLGMAKIDAGLVLLDETGRVAIWDGGTDVTDLLPPGGPTARCRHIAGRGRRLLFGCGTRVELRDGEMGSTIASGTVDHPGRISAMTLVDDDEILIARSQGVISLRRRDDRLVPQATCVLDEGEVLALACTEAEPGQPPLVVAFDEFGWLHVLRPTDGGEMERVGALELEIDGGAPERGGLFCDGPMVMVASGTRLLHLVDLRPPPGVEDPIPMATASLGTGLAGVVADREHVYLADAFYGLVVADRRLFEVCHDDPVITRVALNEPTR